MKGEGVLVVIPAFNEEASVGHVVSAVAAAGFRPLVVSDGSSDGTVAAAVSAGAIVIDLPVNLGVGGALRAGFRYAVRSSYKTVVQCDADGQHPAEEIRLLLDALDSHGADMVVGSRFAGRRSYRVSLGRRLAMRALGAFAARATGSSISDATSGFRAIRSPLLDAFAESYPSEYLGDTVEALVMAGRAGYRVVEVPVAMSTRAHGSPSAGTMAAVWFTVRVAVAVLLRPAALRPRR